MAHLLRAQTRPVAVPPGNRRERHRAQTRDRLYRAALDLFAERGFLETTVEDITESADVGKGTFFNYFPTKEHILAEFGGERMAAVERALETARSTEGSVLEVIGELAMDSAGQSSLNAALIRAIFAAHASCAPVRAELQKRKHVSRRMLAEMFQIGQRRGEIRSDIPASDLASMTQSIFMGLTMSWALNPESTLRKASNDVWQLICPTLKTLTRASRKTGGATKNSARRHHSRSKRPKLS
jgi:AcrR family transcriptional regulator